MEYQDKRIHSPGGAHTVQYSRFLGLRQTQCRSPLFAAGILNVVFFCCNALLFMLK